MMHFLGFALTFMWAACSTEWAESAVESNVVSGYQDRIRRFEEVAKVYGIGNGKHGSP